jgi:hypothetical protein
MIINMTRRLLQMGVASAELFNNLGLSCFQAQQVSLVSYRVVYTFTAIPVDLTLAV